MKRIKKFIFIILCIMSAIGIAYFANKLNSVYAIIMFTVSVFLLSISCIAINK